MGGGHGGGGEAGRGLLTVKEDRLSAELCAIDKDSSSLNEDHTRFL